MSIQALLLQIYKQNCWHRKACGRSGRPPICTRMKAQLENLLTSAKSVTAFLKTWLFSGGRNSEPFCSLNGEKKQLWPKSAFSSRVPKLLAIFDSFSLGVWERSTNVNQRCFIVACAHWRFRTTAKKHGPICLPCRLQGGLCVPRSSGHSWGRRLSVLTLWGCGEKLGGCTGLKGVIFLLGGTTVQDGWPGFQVACSYGREKLILQTGRGEMTGIWANKFSNWVCVYITPILYL